jgi:hypothetical protein
LVLQTLAKGRVRPLADIQHRDINKTMKPKTKIICLNSENQKEIFVKDFTHKNKIRIVKFTSERIDTFPQCIDLIWNFPDGNQKIIKQSPDVFATPYHRRPVYEVWQHTPLLLEDAQYLKFSLNNEKGLTDKGERSNCKIYFEEL